MRTIITVYCFADFGFRQLSLINMTNSPPIQVIAKEVSRRRSFAIISHPDAGKTTLTEKLLLYAGAIQIAGSVKARKASRHATSDWMEIEKQRGISVASSVMQMEYRDCIINLLDTPGHQDFSEDTYRVLTAVDSALMVIDAANGVEAQTRRLIEVCRARNTPLITFINKLDREVKRPLDLMDEIEEALGMSVVPMTWPVGMGKSFAGVIDIKQQAMRMYKAGEDRVDLDLDQRINIHDPKLAEQLGDSLTTALSEVELVQGAMPGFDLEAFLAGKQSPVFFGSAINNFGVQEILNTLVELAPAPKSRPTLSREVLPSEKDFSAVVFKIQANMDPAHRDRVAFLRICSGYFERGMRLKISRNGKEIRTNNALSFLSQRRDILDEAFPGDIIGIPNHGLLQLGDTLTEGEKLQFTGLPFFAPEIFKLVETADPLRTKQLREGLMQLGEEGAIQVFKPLVGTQMLLGAFGQLQFEVVAHRLKSEYNAEVRLLSARYTISRWISSKDPSVLKRFIQENSHRMSEDVVGAPVFLATHKSELEVAQQLWKDVEFHALREHAGLVFQKDLTQ